MFIPLAYQIWKTLKAMSNQRVSSKYRVEPEMRSRRLEAGWCNMKYIN